MLEMYISYYDIHAKGEHYVYMELRPLKDPLSNPRRYRFRE